MNVPQWIADNRAAEALARIQATPYKFVQAADVEALAGGQGTRLTPILVRCGGCRFTAPAQDVAHLIDIITRDGADYVRDASLAITAAGR